MLQPTATPGWNSPTKAQQVRDQLSGRCFVEWLEPDLARVVKRKPTIVEFRAISQKENDRRPATSGINLSSR